MPLLRRQCCSNMLLLRGWQCARIWLHTQVRVASLQLTLVWYMVPAAAAVHTICAKHHNAACYAPIMTGAPGRVRIRCPKSSEWVRRVLPPSFSPPDDPWQRMLTAYVGYPRSENQGIHCSCTSAGALGPGGPCELASRGETAATESCWGAGLLAMHGLAGPTAQLDRC